jgi:hypothetical protein
MNVRDAINVEIRDFRIRTSELPSYIIINRDDYFLLKEEIGRPYDDEITIFAGCGLLVTMDVTKAPDIL